MVGGRAFCIWSAMPSVTPIALSGELWVRVVIWLGFRLLGCGGAWVIRFCVIISYMLFDVFLGVGLEEFL